jgi:hypothetical protein
MPDIIGDSFRNSLSGTFPRGTLERGLSRDQNGRCGKDPEREFRKLSPHHGSQRGGEDERGSAGGDERDETHVWASLAVGEVRARHLAPDPIADEGAGDDVGGPVGIVVGAGEENEGGRKIAGGPFSHGNFGAGGRSSVGWIPEPRKWQALDSADS